MLDLRDDGGGYLPEATALTGLFIDKGPVVQLKDTTGRLEVLDDPEPGTAYDGPLAVLVNRFSASASEIFAGAIQDYQPRRRDRPAHVRQGHRAEPGAARSLVAAAGEWPAHRHHRQVLSRHRREHAASRRGAGCAAALGHRHEGSRRERARFGPALGSHRRRALPHAISARRRRFRRCPPRKAPRAQKDPDYRWLVANIAAIDTLREQKTISLNLAARKLERAEQDTQRLARENSRRTAKGQPAVKTTEELEKARRAGHRAGASR